MFVLTSLWSFNAKKLIFVIITSVLLVVRTTVTVLVIKITDDVGLHSATVCESFRNSCFNCWVLAAFLSSDFHLKDFFTLKFPL